MIAPPKKVGRQAGAMAIRHGPVKEDMGTEVMGN